MVVNTSDGSAWVNKRFMWNAGHAPSYARDIQLEIRSQDDRLLTYDCKANAGPAGPFDYVFLMPGEFIGSDLDLTCAGLKEGERYKVAARFRDMNDSVQLQPVAPRLDWELVSEPIEMTFTSPPRK